MSEERQSTERKPHNRGPRTPRPVERKIDTEQVVSYLSHAFVQAMRKSSHQVGNRNHKGTTLYEYQVDFCYLTNEIQRGPEYILPKIIQDANQLIVELEHETFQYVDEAKEAQSKSIVTTTV